MSPTRRRFETVNTSHVVTNLFVTTWLFSEGGSYAQTKCS
jgi:hypothetical protein